MNKTKVDWADHSINPIKGLCRGGCDYCYAKRMYTRFKWNPAVRLDLSVFDKLDSAKAGSKVFLCSTHDMYGQWIEYPWIKGIIERIYDYPDLTFIILTKNPARAWMYPLPDNVWLGVTVESQEEVWRLGTLIQPEIKAGKKFVSFEPLHGPISCSFANQQTGESISWFIIGAETGNRKGRIEPKEEWVAQLIVDHRGTSVFMKDNLRPYILGRLIQQFPSDSQQQAHARRGREIV